ncbi:MAG TPA: hypothetical protein VN886_23570 [Acidimicrobiales bacterium]|nr:hypothetical protein [Acidimicrobiales bacterium]
MITRRLDQRFKGSIGRFRHKESYAADQLLPPTEDLALAPLAVEVAQ